MRCKSIVATAMAGFLAIPLLATASSQTRFLAGGKPVQVHAIMPVLDRNHDVFPRVRSALESSAGPVDKSRVEAVPAGFEPPLRRGLSNTLPNIVTIAAYVDHDPVSPDSLLDWNCGERTYDTDTFNHNGTDYNGAEFPWLTMANDGMVVVAAADGKIIDRHDGEPDKSCSFDSNAAANYVVLEHADGKITIYAHMKTGSVTPRKIGDNVEQGDYLGVMGSSGASSGPHLHFGVQDRFDDLFDPYAGACNDLNSESLWARQENYRQQDILTLATHSASPEYPPCPQQEKPNFKNVFTSQDTVYASVTVRDFDETDEITVTVRGPNGQPVLSTTYSNSEPGDWPGINVIWAFQIDPQAAAGKYTWEAGYAGQTEKHEFYIGSNPAPLPAAKPANNAYTGLWYDPALDGEGFNIVTTDTGTIVYFYGSDDRGNRVWLISDLIRGEIRIGQVINVLMFESSGGVFPTPVSSARGLSIWGTLKLVFSACDTGQSILTGMDGDKTSQITKLAGVSGASCVAGDVPTDSAWAGLWYDPDKDGEGYNLIVAPVGRILYFYGFRKNGLRLWLISDLITQTLEPGKTVEATLFVSNQGTFAVPVPSSDALFPWGTARITVLGCDSIGIVMEGADGEKTSHTVRLAGIIGSSCGS